MEPRSYNKSFIPAHWESGRLAQLGERQLDMLEVGGSKPSPPTIGLMELWVGFGGVGVVKPPVQTLDLASS